MGIYEVVALFGPAFGPSIGGILADTLGWRSIVWVLDHHDGSGARACHFVGLSRDRFAFIC